MKLKQWIILFIFGLVLTVFAACSSGESDSTSGEGSSDGSSEATEEVSEDEGEKVLNFKNPENIPTIDSSHTKDQSSFVYLAATTEGLYHLNENAQSSELIAEDHQVSEDDLTWTFSLHENAT